MSFTFSIGYRTPISSYSLNQKLHEVWGRNGVLAGFEISKHSNTQVKVSSGKSIIKGAQIEYKEDNAGNPLRVEIPLKVDGNKYIYGLYNHKLAAFTLHVTDGKYDAQGDWKVFLGHAKVVGGAITEIQPIVEPSFRDIDPIYKRMPNMNEVINFFYDAAVDLGDQITVIMNGMIGNMKTLKTDHKETIVGSINELYDTKEPTLTRDRILELLGGEGGNGNINIDSINGIPIKRFVLDDRAIRTLQNSGLKGGGDLTVDRSLSIDWGNKENQVPRGTHNHTGYHLDKKFGSKFGDNEQAAVYTQVAYHAKKVTSKGVLKIILPKNFTNANLAITIKGYNADANNSVYTLQLGGVTNKTSASWSLCTADILGKAPFKKVSFGKDSSNKPCIILGDSSTNWTKGSLFVEQVLVSGEDSSDWNNGWDIIEAKDMSGTNIDQAPSITTGGPQTGEFVPPNRSINAGTGLTGGGTLSNDVNLGVDFGTGHNNVARGQHDHSQYLDKYMGSKYGVLVTDGNGNAHVDDLIWVDELRRLTGIKDNIQTQLNNKSDNGHGHGQYFPRSGGEMDGAVNMKWHWFNSDNCNINGVRVSVGSGQPSPVGWGHVWIQLT